MEVLLALLPILLIFAVLQIFCFKLPRKALSRIVAGLGFTFFGLTLFLVGVNGGFMDVGRIIGYELASIESKVPLVVIGFLLGCVTILAEPAVYVLTHQIEEVTSGYVPRKIVLISLAIGVGFSVALSMIRILIPEVKLWHYLLPGYILSLAMSYFVPKLFVGMAFDSGGVASGPMTATFILAFAQGAADAIEGADVMVDGFGMIAMVALTPLIALQTLGLLYKLKSGKKALAQAMNSFNVADVVKICVIVNTGMGSKVLHKAKNYGIRGGTVLLGTGTVSSRVLEYLGLSDSRKEIVYMIAQRSTAHEALEKLNRDFDFEKPNHGIAFTTNVTALVGTHGNIAGGRDEEKGENYSMYHAITTIVDRGRAEDVIDAAAKAGSKGGTIVKAHGSGIHETSRLFSMDIEPEKEIVLILAEADRTKVIVESIRKELKIDEPGQGILFVQEVVKTFGLYK